MPEGPSESDSRPALSIGCAVYRSDERRLRRSLDSILGQTFEDFEVIICDNSPDEATAGICLEYARRDPRVRYYHNDINLGAYPSFWRSFQIARGRYFKWAADDDELHPTYVARCLEVLDRDPQVALCYSRIVTVGPDDARKEGDLGGRIEARQAEPVDRFLAVLSLNWRADGFYGIFRTRHLRRVHPVSDECVRLADILLLAEISLHGTIHQIPEELFTYTQHPKDWDDREKLNSRQYEACFPNNPNRGITFPNLKFAGELLEAVRYADLPLADKAKLYAAVPPLIRQRLGTLWAQEIRRCLMLVLGHRIFHEWGEPVAEIEPARHWRRIPDVYRFHASELLRRLELVQLLWPDYPEPGIHTARAVLLTVLERVPEAHAALQVELARFPDFAAARQMIRNIEASRREPAPVG